MIEYFIAWLIFILFGALIGALIAREKTRTLAWILIFSIGVAIISGVLLLVIWAMLTISQFFGIPLIVIIAVVILAWFIFRR